MTYNVFGGTLSLTQSINQSCVVILIYGAAQAVRLRTPPNAF